MGKIMEVFKQLQREEGKREVAISIARRMKKDGNFPNEQIAKYTNLTLQEIENL